MGFLLPNFRQRRQKLEPVRFVPVAKAFKAQIQVQAVRDLNGWVSHERRLKWAVKKNQVFYLDEDKAREFETKGYVRIVNGEIQPVSEDEAAEILSTSTTITLGGAG